MQSAKCVTTRKRYPAAFTLVQFLVLLAVVGGIVWGVSAYRHKQAEKIAQALKQAELQKPLLVKGLFVGMTADEITQAVHDKFDGSWRVYGEAGARSLEIVTDKLNPLLTKGDYAIDVIFDDDHRAQAVIIGENCSRLLFDSTDALTAEQFVKNFMDAYHIENMEDGKGCWYFANSYNNTTVKITTEKAVLLYKGADAQRLQSDFN